MEVVKDWSELRANLEELERLRSLGAGFQFRDYVDFVKRGTCFVPYESEGALAFAPSRFVGYAGNTLERHATNRAKDGRVTNPAISAIIGSEPQESSELEQHYASYCRTLGFEPRAAGSFGVRRKYWLTSEAAKLLASG